MCRLSATGPDADGGQGASRPNRRGCPFNCLKADPADSELESRLRHFVTFPLTRSAATVGSEAAVAAITSQMQPATVANPQTGG